MWQSSDQGRTWNKQRELTRRESDEPHLRPASLNAHPDFFAIWADGHGRKPSDSPIYFANSTGDVFQLPENMTSDQNVANIDRVSRVTNFWVVDEATSPDHATKIAALVKV